MELECDSYQHKKYGEIFYPVLDVKRWISIDAAPAEPADEGEADGDQPPPDDAEAAPEPAQPRRRRRRAAASESKPDEPAQQSSNRRRRRRSAS